MTGRLLDGQEEPSAFIIQRGSNSAARILGTLIFVIGLALFGGGAWLLAIGGSAYYVTSGTALVIAGTMLNREYLVGAWIYLCTLLATMLWAFWEVGLDGWALVPRLVGPIILGVAVVLVMPTMTRRVGRWKTALSAALCLSAGLVLVAFLIQSPRHIFAGLDSGRLIASMSDPSVLQAGVDWPAYGGSYGAKRYSPLSQITPDNVFKLERVWLAHTGDMPTSRRAALMYGAETTPLKIGERLYLCSAKNMLVALDASTGKMLWHYDPQVGNNSIPYTAACRGVSYVHLPDHDPMQPCATRIVEGTLDGRIIAVDSATGKPCEEFGDHGQIRITDHMGDAYPGMVSITSPPVIIRGVIVTGHSVLDGQKRWAPSGVIQGFDATTGKLRWGWDMMHPDWTAGPPTGQVWSRGTPNMWTIASADEGLGLVYLPLGNAAVDYWSSSRRPDENRFANSLVALDVITGKPRWHFQTVINDVWDYDLGSQASLIDWPSPNGPIPALVLPTKQGDIYIIDRQSGRALTSVTAYRAPSGGVEPGERALIQKMSGFHVLRQPDITERSMWGMSPIDQMICRIQFRQAVYHGVFTAPTTDRPYIQYPGTSGGVDWGSISIDPLRGIIIANYNDAPNYNRLVPRAEADRLGTATREKMQGGFLPESAERAGDPQEGAPYSIFSNQGWRLKLTGLLCKQPPYGGIRAIDLRSGRTLWDRPLGSARRNGPFGIMSRLPFEIGTPNMGGSITTASGLIFIAATTDNLIRAIDIRTGKTVWQDELPAGGQATPMTYWSHGRQYVVIMTGGHHFMETPIGDQVIAYALPVAPLAARRR